MGTISLDGDSRLALGDCNRVTGEFDSLSKRNYPLSISPISVFVILARHRFLLALRDAQVWTMAGLTVVFPLLYYVFSTSDTVLTHVSLAFLLYQLLV